MGELSRLLDAHLVEHDMTREQFAQRCCELGWCDTRSEALALFDVTQDPLVVHMVGAADGFGFSEEEMQKVWEAAMSDARKRTVANWRARSN